jgi:hypothetical protein
MTDLFEVTLGLDDSDLTDEEKLEFQLETLPELRDLDEVEKADRCENLNIEPGSKPGFASLIGVIIAQINGDNIKDFLGWLGQRFHNKPIKLSVKVGDREISVEVGNHQSLTALDSTVQKLIEALKDK